MASLPGGVQMSERLLLALTENIYDAATGGTPWRAVGDGLCRLLQAQSASLMAGDFTSGEPELLYHGHIPLEAVQAYRTHYRAVDLWTTRAARALRAPGSQSKVWIGGTLVPDREFLNSEF